MPIFEQLAKIKKIGQTKSNPNSKKITKIKTKKYFLINLKNKKIDKNLINDDLLSNLNNLTKIWGNANLSCSQVIDFGELKEIGENAYFGFSKITDLKNLEKIGGHAYFVNSKIETAPNLKNIEGEIYFNK